MKKILDTIKLKWTEYLLEIIVIVIGILGAFTLNNWNQARQTSKQEVLLLTQLLNEYQNNLNQLNIKITSRNEILKSTVKLLSCRKLEENQIDVDSVNIHISRTLTRPTFDPDLGVTNELTNSGNLYIITNLELRNHITSFPSFLYELKEEEMVIFNLVEERYFPFLIANYQIGPVVKNFLTDSSFMDKNLLNISTRTGLPEDLIEVSSPMELISNPDMSDYLMLMWANTDYTNVQSIGVKMKMESIIALISHELSEKK